MTKQRSSRIGRLAVPLLGLLVTAHLLVPEERIEATASRNNLVESLKLDPTDGFEVVAENVYSKEQLFNHNFFKERFDNRQVWAAFQLLRTGKHAVCLYFIDFRTEEDADWAMKRLSEAGSEWSNRVGRIYGTAVAYAQAPFDTPIEIVESFLDAVSAKAGQDGSN